MAQLIKTCAGLAIASVKTVNDLAIASAKTIAGLDNTSGGGGLTFDAVSSGTTTVAATLTVSHTCTGSNGLLLVLCGFGLGSVPAVTAATYNGVAMTGAITGFAASDATPFCNTLGYYLVAPATGTHDIVFTLASAPFQMAVVGLSFAGAHQTVPFGTAATGTSVADKNPTVNVSSASGEMVASVVCGDFAAMTVSGSNTQRFKVENLGADLTVGASTAAGSGTVTMSWTGSGGDNGWAISAVPIKPA